MPIILSREKKIRMSSNILCKEDKKIITPEEWSPPEVMQPIIPNIEDLEQTQVITFTPSEFVEFGMKLPDKDGDSQSFIPFSFKNREYWRSIYDTSWKRILMKTGRQCEKSTFVGNRMLTYCCMNVGFHALFVTPTQNQAKVFRNDRIKGPIETSDILKKWVNTSIDSSVFLQGFSNYSKITMRYAFLTADRIRGISGVDCLVLDELQDIILENIPIIEQTAFAGSERFRIFMYCGTPKSLDNPIEKYWIEASTQNEWAIPCWRHSFFSGNKIVKGYWNIIVDDKNIQRHGLSCDKCGELINPRDPACHWVSMNPSIKDDSSNVKQYYEGYHIPQLISPRCDWDKVLQDYHFIPRQQFFNEVLGISYDSGDKPLTRQDVIDNCADVLSMSHTFLENFREKMPDAPIYAGIDWSGGSERSFTVLCLATYLQVKGHYYFTPFYWKRFDGPDSDPRIQIEKIIDILKRWKVMFVGCDYGGGYWPNDELTRKFGASKIWKYQYSNPKIKVKWEPGLKRFIVHRSEVMSDVFNAIKRRDIFLFPRWEEFEKPFAEDFLNITSEFNEQRNCIFYQKTLNGTDDSFHALVTCFLSSFHQHPRHDIINVSALTSYADM